jgi:alpha-L-arabinofuranosidase
MNVFPAGLAIAGAIMSLICVPEMLGAPTVRVTVDVSKPGVAVSPTMFGLFFEDINYGADGGLYAELVQNRSFEHRDPMVAWTTASREGEGEVQIATTSPLHPKNPHFARLQVRSARGGFGVSNSGFGGIPLKKDENYIFSVYARAGGLFRGPLVAVLEDDTGRALGEFRITSLEPQWRKFEGIIKSTDTVDNARLTVLAMGSGQVDLDMISLFPENTWNKRRNGLRADMVKILADMKPGFMRFPGGCIVEGKDLANAYRWKDTIGDVATRPQNWNRWMETNAPQYYQTYGLGFYEYFQLCEDIGAEPVPVINCGMACQFQSGEVVPMGQLKSWVQDALDLIEFANGPSTTVWGAKRAAMGHPKPFNLKVMGVGNEQWGDNYFPRYKVFYDAIKARYPQMIISTTSGPGVDDRWWHMAWDKFKTGTPAEIVDEHYYRPPEWFLQQTQRYDGYDRKGPKVFAGEYASHGPDRRNNLEVALTEAAYMTGLLRNADVVLMAAYAPLFAKDGNTQWAPDLIWFNNTQVYGSPSYHVQAMYGRNRPDMTFPTQVSHAESGAEAFPGMVGVGTWKTQAEFRDIRVTKDNKTLFASDFSKGTDGWKMSRGQWSVVNGALRQTSGEEDVRAVVGDPSWSDYTLSLKARKVSGDEGFLIIFQSPNDDAKRWWSVGGWGNTQHNLEVPGVTSKPVRGKIEPKRWYDIRIELQGAKIKCYLDGKLVQQATRRTVSSLYAVAGRDNKTGEAIVNVVNVSSEPVEVEVALRGAPEGTFQAKSIVLTSDSPKDENSFNEPDKVKPREETITVALPTFTRTFPAHSFTVLRVQTKQL